MAWSESCCHSGPQSLKERVKKRLWCQVFQEHFDAPGQSRWKDTYDLTFPFTAKYPDCIYFFQHRNSLLLSVIQKEVKPVLHVTVSSCQQLRKLLINFREWNISPMLALHINAAILGAGLVHWVYNSFRLISRTISAVCLWLYYSQFHHVPLSKFGCVLLLRFISCVIQADLQ